MLQPLRELFPAGDHPDLLVGLAAADDAAVYRLSDSQAIISTTDFFPPVVDDPYDFGAIAAANALSDIYAMGGRPVMAINLVAFPEDLDRRILREILRGGAEVIAEAGAVIAGGHSINDREPKYGLAVTGVVDPKGLKTKGGSRPGERLLLTKPLGTGLVTTALKQGIAAAEDVAAAVASMRRLNRGAAEAAAAAGVQSMTDVTGFGLLGHAHEMAHLSEVDFELRLDGLEWLPGAGTYAEAGAFPAGMHKNRAYFGRWLDFDTRISELWQEMLWTPETSGGILAAVAPGAVNTFAKYCPSAVIGRVTAGAGRIRVLSGNFD